MLNAMGLRASVALAIALPHAGGGAAHAAAQDPIALTNATVVAVEDGRVVPDQVILIADGEIVSAGAAGSVPVPPNVRTIDLGGRYVAPGLIDFHVHLRHPSELVTYLRHGVTTIVQLSAGLSGAPDVLDYRRDLAAGRLLGPTLYTSGPLITGDPPINPDVSTVVGGEADAIGAVRAQATAGYDLVKVYNRLPARALPAVVRAAHDAGMPVVGHVPRPDDRATALQAALAAGLDVIAHGEEFFFSYFYSGVDELLDAGEIPWRDPRGIDEVVRWVLEARTAVVPNLSFVRATRIQLDSIEQLWSDREFDALEPAVREFWQRGNFPRIVDDVDRFSRRELAKEAFLDQLTLAMWEAGVPLFLGTDASYVGLFPGTSAHLELAQLVEAGLTPRAALTAGTAAPGAFLHERGLSPLPLGRVSAGATADLIVLGANPLANVEAVRQIEAVISRGRLFTIDELEEHRQSAGR